MKQRQLNIELMRIFSMMLILLWHISGKMLPLLPNGVNHIAAPLNSINLFITFHVDLFVLITGFFGIRHRRASLVKTILLCLFYTGLLSCISSTAYMGGVTVDWKDFLPFSSGPWWFMKNYLLLLLIAPILERYMHDCTHREFYIMLAIAVFVSVYMGWFMHVPLYDNHGYDIFNFILLYILGHWLRREDWLTIKMKTDFKVPLIVFLLCCAVRYKVQPITCVDWWDYSSPLNIIMAICVFCMFLKVRVPARAASWVMFFSSSAISVYLVTDYPGFRPLLSKILGWGMATWPTAAAQLACVLVFIVACFIVCCMIDKLRILLVNSIMGMLMKK